MSAAEITHSDGSFLLGEFTDKTYTAEDGSTYPYQVTTFTADSINLGSGVVVNVTGSNPLSLRTRNNGSLTLGTTINVSGGSRTEGPDAGGIGVAVGTMVAILTPTDRAQVEEKQKVWSPDPMNRGRGRYGGRGYDNDSAYSLTYGNVDLGNHLIGGSGGGGGDLYPGGAGGGAVELVAHGDGALTITGSIKANGGDASRAHAESGGGGSGGSIRLEGGSVSISGTGGQGWQRTNRYSRGVVVWLSKQTVTFPSVRLLWTDTTQVPYISQEPRRQMRSTFQVVR